MILKINCFLILFFSFVCCQSQESNDSIPGKEEVFIIKHFDQNERFQSILADSLEFYRIEYYFDYNIILIDTIPDIYYHKKRFFCLTGREMRNNLPFFRNLQPEYFQKNMSITEILNQVLSDSIRAESVYPKRVNIAYNRDTIMDERYFQLKNLFIKNNIAVSTRNPTEEEDVILRSIINNRKYKPEEIEWQRTQYVPDKKFLKRNK